MRVFFDARELYFLTQYMPVQRVLESQGEPGTFVAYRNRPTEEARIRKAFEEAGLPVVWLENREEGLEFYQREAPDWILFGNSYGYLAELPPSTQTGMLYHGIGMKLDVYGPGLVTPDVRFVEGPYYTQRISKLYPDANVVEVGYPKIDPLLATGRSLPTFDLEGAGLDPTRPTLLYAPTHSPTSFPNMADAWPEHFADCNLIVKPHYLSYFGSRRKSHRRKMELWSRAPNVHVAGIDEYDPAPFMNAADLMISDLSAVVFEFAATGKPVIWNDFLHIHWTRRGPFAYRYWRRMDRDVLERYGTVGVHAKRYRDLESLVRSALDNPDHGAAERRSTSSELVGALDGRSAERVVAYLRKGAPRARASERMSPLPAG